MCYFSTIHCNFVQFFSKSYNISYNMSKFILELQNVRIIMYLRGEVVQGWNTDDFGSLLCSQSTLKVYMTNLYE